MTPGQLVKAMALALDVPEETVVQHDRNLVVAGLRTKGGRGRSAPKVTPLDAARLLVATLASIRAKDSVETVRAFEQTKFIPRKETELLRFWREDLPGADADKHSDPAITALPPGHSFVDAVTSLISDASSPVVDLEDHHARFALIIIQCHTPRVAARIMHGAWGAHYLSAEAPARLPYVEAFYGIKQDREIFGIAIMLLGKAFRDSGLAFKTAKDALAALYSSKKAPARAKKKVS